MDTEERVVLRPRRQITLPRKVCDALGIKPGDGLMVEVKDGVLIGRPARAAALEALRAIQQAFAESGISEEELLEGGRQIREELFREKYGYLLEEDRKGKRSKRRSA